MLFLFLLKTMIVGPLFLLKTMIVGTLKNSLKKLLFIQNINCGYSLELPLKSAHNGCFEPDLLRLTDLPCH